MSYGTVCLTVLQYDMQYMVDLHKAHERGNTLHVNITLYFISLYNCIYTHICGLFPIFTSYTSASLREMTTYFIYLIKNNILYIYIYIYIYIELI